MGAAASPLNRPLVISEVVFRSIARLLLTKLNDMNKIHNKSTENRQT